MTKVDPEREATPCRSHECKRVRAEMQAEIDWLRRDSGFLRLLAQSSYRDDVIDVELDAMRRKAAMEAGNG